LLENEPVLLEDEPAAEEPPDGPRQPSPQPQRRWRRRQHHHTQLHSSGHQSQQQQESARVCGRCGVHAPSARGQPSCGCPVRQQARSPGRQQASITAVVLLVAAVVLAGLPALAAVCGHGVSGSAADSVKGWAVACLVSAAVMGWVGAGPCKRPLSCALCMREWRRARYIARGRWQWLHLVWAHAVVYSVALCWAAALIVFLLSAERVDLMVVGCATSGCVALCWALGAGVKVALTATCSAPRIRPWLPTALCVCALLTLWGVSRWCMHFTAAADYIIRIVLVLWLHHKLDRHLLLMLGVLLVSLVPVSAAPGCDGAASVAPASWQQQVLQLAAAATAAAGVASTWLDPGGLNPDAPAFVPGQQWRSGSANPQQAPPVPAQQQVHVPCSTGKPRSNSTSKPKQKAAPEVQQMQQCSTGKRMPKQQEAPGEPRKAQKKATSQGLWVGKVAFAEPVWVL
jgi:hypothetical protein